MSFFGYTAGGSPIFFPAVEKKAPYYGSWAKKNPRFKCKACGHSTTKNQLKSNGCVCHQCKLPMPGRIQPPPAAA